MMRLKSVKILSALTLMFALPVTTIAGTFSQHVQQVTSEKSVVVFGRENNYSSVLTYSYNIQH